MAKRKPRVSLAEQIRRRKKIDPAGVIDGVADVLAELAKFESKLRCQHETGYEVLPIGPTSWLDRGVGMLRQSLGGKLPDCGDQVWTELYYAANAGNVYQTESRVAEFRQWLVYQLGRFTFAKGVRPEPEEHSSTTQS